VGLTQEQIEKAVRIINQQLYESQSNNTRFLPVVFSPKDADYIPR
jgi:hypothetical protein